MRAKRVYEFLKTGDVKSSLGIGRVAEIRELFREYGISDENYIISDIGVVFNGDLYLRDTTISELPERLTVRGDLDLRETPIAKLPDGLNIRGSLYLGWTNIKELPEDLFVLGGLSIRATSITELPQGLTMGGNIYIDSSQDELKNQIESSKFKNKLLIL